MTARNYFEKQFNLMN